MVARIKYFIESREGNGILALGEDNRMYLWNYANADWDLLQNDEN